MPPIRHRAIAGFVRASLALTLVFTFAASTVSAVVISPDGPSIAPDSGAAEDVLPAAPFETILRAIATPAHSGLIAPRQARPASPMAIQAIAALVAGNLHEALRLAEEDIRLSGETAPMLEVAGAARAIDGDTDAGLSLLRRSVALDPNQVTAYVKIGEILLRRGDLTEAEKVLQAAIDRADDPQAHQRLGLIAEMRGKEGTAIDHYRKGLRNTPPHYVGIAENLARLLARQGAAREAIAVLSPRLDAAEPRNRNAFLVLAGARLIDGDAAAAVADVHTAIRLGDSSPEASIMLAIAAREAGKFAESRKALEPLAAGSMAMPAALFQLGETELAAGDRAAAVAAYQRLLAQAPTNQAGMRRIAQIQFAMGDNDAGERILGRLASLSLPTETTLAFLANVRRAQGRFDLAEAAARMRLERFPDSAEASFSLGTFLAAQRKYDEALPALEQASLRNPAEPRYLRAQAVAELRRGNQARAIAVTSALAKLENSTPDDWFFLGSMLDQQRRTAEAQQLYERTIAVNPRHGPALNNLAMLVLGRGQIADAIALSERATQALPESAEAFGTLAIALSAGNRHAEALPAVTRALGLRPADPDLHLQAAEIQARLGDKIAARTHAERVLALSEDNNMKLRARSLLARLR